MKALSLGALALSSLLVFSACGGGGSGGGSMSGSDGMDPSMNPPSVEEAQADITAVRATANSLLMTDLVATSRSAVHANTRGLTTCGGTPAHPSRPIRNPIGR